MRKIISVFLLAAAVITGASAATAQAASVTAVATADISADSSTGSSVALPAITIAEQAAGDIAEGAFVLSLPAGFAFDASSIANVAATGAGLAASSTVSFTDAGHAAVTVTATSTEAGSITVGSVVPLKVKAAAGTPLAAGNITLSSGAIAGLAATTSLGTLTEISGAPAKLAFTAQPSASVQVGSVFSTSTVAVKDQFGNTVTSDNGRAIGLTVIPVSPATTTGALGGNTSASTASGTAIFGNLTFSVPGVIQLQANASGLASVASNSITVNATTTAPTSTPPASCNLQNGSLVKVEGSSTIYLVVNCVLRPFTTAAVFHSRGKRFEDVRNISNDIFHRCGIGRNVGDGNDNDSTVVVPPATTTAASTTVPAISGLPDGAIVKLPNNPTVYLVSGGQLQPFTSTLTFSLRGKRFSDIQTISTQDFSRLTVGSPVGLPDNAVFKGSGSTIFALKNGKRFGIPSMASFMRHGWSLGNVVTISDADLAGLQFGGVED